MNKLSLTKKIELAPHSKSKVMCNDGIERTIKNDTDTWVEIGEGETMPFENLTIAISTNGNILIY